jgi:hypothetical protein
MLYQERKTEYEDIRSDPKQIDRKQPMKTKGAASLIVEIAIPLPSHGSERISSFEVYIQRA